MKSIVELRHVTLERPGRTILNAINWTVRPGQHWIVMGLNGSGKTSLLTLILGYTWPTGGEVEVLGQLYGTVDLREHRKRMGWVSQHLAEWMTRDHGHVSVRDLVESGREAVIGKSLGQGEAPYHLGEVLDTFRLRSLAHTRFSSLSQGEKTRVLLARAWMAQVELLILDEPCSGLDIRHREELLALIGQHFTRASSTHVIYVTHHPEEILPGFTHALLLHQGAVFAQGRKEEVLTSKNLSAILEVPVDVEFVHGRPWIRVTPTPDSPTVDKFQRSDLL